MGSVVLAPGFEPFDPTSFDTYSYAQHPNVITAMEFERVLSASGPYQGHLQRPSDGVEPKKIAWLQCVGSRDIHHCDHGYCSSVCCMYAVKEAVIAKEHASDELDAAIFFMDMRTVGKDFEKYYDRARDEHGLRFIRSRVHTVDPIPGDKLRIEYATEAGEAKIEEFDMVVLSVGMQTSAEAIKTAQLLDVDLTNYNFTDTSSFKPVATSREGVYACGAFAGPKDIPQSVMEASAAACEASISLSQSRGTLTQELEYPLEKDVSGEQPRVGVFVCDCGINIAGIVDVPGVRDYAATLPYVEFVVENMFTCSQDTQNQMKDLIKEHNLNRLVVASCSPRTHEPLFQETIREAGLNKYLFEMANIRDQCSWVHSAEPGLALEKAQDLLASAVAKARGLVPLEEQVQPVVQTALVIGGGLAGMVAAQNLADQGFDVHLVERSAELGGQLRHIRRTLEGDDVAKLMNDLIDRTQSHPGLTLHQEAEVQSCSGSVGNFESVIAAGGKRQTLRHGVTIVATGAEMYDPVEYGHGSCDKVITQRELERRLGLGLADEAGHVVMIQCVGCRTEERPYCSRICCGEAVKNALEIKEQKPDCRVTVLYKDVRTFGRMEKHYLRAREAGVVFMRYDDEHKPEVGPSGTVGVTDLATGRQYTLEPDLIALSAAVVGREQDRTLAQTLRVPMTQDGFFLEAHIKLRPVDFACEGIFLAGLAHGPKFIPETIAQALAAAGRAATIISKETIRASGSVSVVDADLCAACLTCVRVCPYSVPRIEDGVATIDAAACQGCGVCAAECPAGAVALQSFTDAQLQAAVAGLFRAKGPDPKEVAKR